MGPSMARLWFLRLRCIGIGLVIRIFLRYGLCFPNRSMNAARPDNISINDVLCPRAQRGTQDQCAKEPNSIAPNHGRKIMDKMFTFAIAGRCTCVAMLDAS